MDWLGEAIERLTTRPVCGYGWEGASTVEPTALAAQALVAAGRGEQAMPALDWLVTVQAADGSLGIDLQTCAPCWPTGWAILAWNSAALTPGPSPKGRGELPVTPGLSPERKGELPDAKAKWSAAARRATTWMVRVSGRPVERGDAAQRFVGHDTTLQGWPWVVGTHSWVEPTAINLLALRSAGQAGHPRAREAVKLLLDRQLPAGGWNYGNTTVLDHVLYAQVQPTGLALAALAGEMDIRPKVLRSIQWLEHALAQRTTTASLCYALMGLAAHGIWPQAANEWLQSAYRRTLERHGSPYHLALLVLAAKKRTEFHGTRD
jgi:hypothetical protein